MCIVLPIRIEDDMGLDGSRGAETMKCTLWTDTLEFWKLVVPKSRFALHGLLFGPSPIHDLWAMLASNSLFMNLSQALFTLALTAPFFASLSIHGLFLHGLRASEWHADRVDVTFCSATLLPRLYTVWVTRNSNNLKTQDILTNNNSLARLFQCAFWRSFFSSIQLQKMLDTPFTRRTRVQRRFFFFPWQASGRRAYAENLQKGP